jgi:microcystin-dependent protein
MVARFLPVPDGPSLPKAEPLPTLAGFRDAEGTSFEVQVDDRRTVEVTLVEVRQADRRAGWETFSLLFDGSDEPFPQAAYRVQPPRAVAKPATTKESRMSEPFLAQIMMFGGNFAPRGWALCNGQILPIAQNTALFSLLGTTFGGNGQTTFALPDLRSRVPVHPGQGPGLSNVSLGEAGGGETVTLTQNEMPQHAHLVAASNGGTTASRPANNFLAAGGSYTNASDGTTMNPAMVGVAGGSLPHENRQPYLGVNFIIALEGIFPSRN